MFIIRSSRSRCAVALWRNFSLEPDCVVSVNFLKGVSSKTLLGIGQSVSNRSWQGWAMFELRIASRRTRQGLRMLDLCRRRYPSVAVGGIFITSHGRGCSPKVKNPAKRVRNGVRWSAFARHSPPKSAFARLLARREVFKCRVRHTGLKSRNSGVQMGRFRRLPSLGGSAVARTLWRDKGVRKAGCFGEDMAAENGFDSGSGSGMFSRLFVWEK
jgi:hypothetical protein